MRGRWEEPEFTSGAPEFVPSDDPILQQRCEGLGVSVWEGSTLFWSKALKAMLIAISSSSLLALILAALERCSSVSQQQQSSHA